MAAGEIVNLWQPFFLLWQIAAGSSDKTIRVWDLATGAALALFKGHKDDVESVDFSAVSSCFVQPLLLMYVLQLLSNIGLQRWRP